jgi:hypothetical protein
VLRPAIRHSAPAKFVALLLLLLCAYLVCRNAIVLLTARSAPQVAATFPPAAGEALMRLSLVAPAGEAREMMRKGLARDPLSQTPFLLAAEQARQKGQLGDYADAIQAALRREPVGRASRSQRFQLNVIAGRWNEALDDIRSLWKAEPRLHPVLMKQLIVLAGDLRGRALLFRKLRDDSRWRKSFISTLEAQNPRDPLLTAWTAYDRILKRKDGDAQVRLNPDGYILWVARLPRAEVPKVGAIFDGTFSAKTVGVPFAWSFPAGSGSPARPSASGLAITLAGAGRQVLATQHLVLPQFTYRLSGPVSASANLAWHLRCLDGRRIAELPLSQSADAGGTFQVPANCPIQRLELVGSAPDRSASAEAELQRIEILPRL